MTLPGSPARAVGHLHPITRTRRLIEDVMVGLGYRVMEGPEVEHDFYNFTALNHPEDHPARMLQDTFYVDASGPVESEGEGPRDVLLRTHTSPMQVRAMETAPPPIFMIVPGKTYRRDSDATHSPMFHQVEGLAVGEGITLADLKGTLLAMLREIFGPDREIRMRPHFFPFTEPSVEFDVSCFRCGGSGRLDGGDRCGLCKGIGWIELGGAGMVDPNVFGFVSESGYDPDSVTGFAFGFGIERIAMLRHGVGDLRLLLRQRRENAGAVLMKVPYSWMAEYCDPGLEPEVLAEKLAMTGTEVERVVTTGPPKTDGFVIGRGHRRRTASRRRPALRLHRRHR